MLKKFILIFAIIITNLFSMNQFAKAFGDKRDNYFNPTITKKYEDEYYLADYFSGDIMIYNKDFNLKRVYSENEKLNDINKIGDELWISNGEKNHIKIINLVTNKISYIGQKGIRRNEFSNPGEIEKDNDYIYIVDEHNDRIQVFNKNKVFVKEFSFPKASKSKVGFSLNYSMKKMNEVLYVLDKSNKLIYKYKDFSLTETIDLKNFLEPYKLYVVDKKVYVYEKRKNEFVDIYTNKKSVLDVDREISLIDINSFGEGPLGVYITKNSKLYYFSLIADTSRELKTIVPVEKGYYVKPLEIRRDSEENVYILDGILNEILVYSSNGTYLNRIQNLPQDSYSFDIDVNGDFLVLSNKTNSLYRINEKSKVVDYIENSSTIMSYEPYFYKGKNKKGIIDNALYYNKIIVDKKNNLIYLTDNRNKKIKVLNAKFRLLNDFGKKEGLVNTLSKKISPDAFSFNDYNRNSMVDIEINNNLFVIDSPYKRIMEFSGNSFSKTLTNEKFSSGINSISFYKDKIIVVDKDLYKLYVFSKDMKLEKEINMAKKGYRPIKLRGNLLIVTSYVKEFNEKYIILDISTLI